jgi:glucose-1-phosphate thymidylyltransferase
MTDVLSQYAKRGELTYSILKSKWTDAGSFESLYYATLLMKKLEEKLLNNF